jgi:hypothetical protein
MVWDKICIMLPTYGRSDTLLPKFLSSCIQTAGNLKNIRFAFCVNGNDTETIRYIKTHNIYGTGVCKIVLENLPTPNLAKYFNMLYEASASFGSDCLVSQLGDDMVFNTPGWDIKLLEAVNNYDGIGIFWMNDDYIAHERCAVNLFLTRKMVEATEKPFMCEEFAADFIDYIWTRIGKLTRTSHYFPDIIIKHNHNTSKPKEKWDATFQRLAVIQNEAKKLGKTRANEIANEISAILIKKGFTGNSI